MAQVLSQKLHWTRSGVLYCLLKVTAAGSPSSSLLWPWLLWSKILWHSTSSLSATWEQMFSTFTKVWSLCWFSGQRLYRLLRRIELENLADYWLIFGHQLQYKRRHETKRRSGRAIGKRGTRREPQIKVVEWCSCPCEIKNGSWILFSLVGIENETEKRSSKSLT